MTRSLLAISVLTIGMMPAVAAAAPNGCTIGGWSIVTEAGGVPVRADPSPGAPIVGRLPPAVDYEGGLFSGRGPEFSIVEADGGWFRIANVYVQTVKEDDVEEVPLDVTGWIPGRAIYFGLQTYKGFAKPDPTSEVVYRFGELSHPRDWLAVTDCLGEWAQIAYGTPQDEKRMWVRGICAAQETSCDGVKGDN